MNYHIFWLPLSLLRTLEAKYEIEREYDSGYNGLFRLYFMCIYIYIVCMLCRQFAHIIKNTRLFLQTLNDIKITMSEFFRLILSIHVIYKPKKEIIK